MKFIITTIFLSLSYIALSQCIGTITPTNTCLESNMLDSYDSIPFKQTHTGEVWYTGYFTECVKLDVSSLNGDVAISFYISDLCGVADTTFYISDNDSTNHTIQYCNPNLDWYVNILFEVMPGSGISCLNWRPVPPYLSTPVLLNLDETQEDVGDDLGNFHEDDNIERWYTIYDITGRQVNRFYGLYNDALQYLDYMGIFVVYNEERHESYRVAKY